MQDRKDDIAALVKELDLSMNCVFVPWSQSRNYDPGIKNVLKKSLNWKITLLRGGKELVTFDYMQGIAHAPSYPSGGALYRGLSVDQAAQLEAEVENGRKFVTHGSFSYLDKSPRGTIPEPALFDVLYSVVQDAYVLDYNNFESWADNYGFNSDSRKDEKIYKACLQIGLSLRNALGDDNLTRLQKAFQDY